MTIIDSKNFVQYLSNLEIHNYIKEINKYSSKINKYVNDNEPWNRKLNSDTNIKNILNTSINSIKNIFILLHPIMPKKIRIFFKFTWIKIF